MPTDPSALRALLLTQAKQQQAQAVAEEKWNPLVGPALRSALYTSEGTDVYLSVTGHHNLPPDPYGS